MLTVNSGEESQNDIDVTTLYFYILQCISTINLFSSFYINIVVEKHWHVATIHIFSVNGYAVPPLVIFFL